MSIRQYLTEFVRTAFQMEERDRQPDFDMEFIQGKSYGYITTTDTQLRCDICGRQYDTEAIKSLWRHMQRHYENGVIDDPYRVGSQVAMGAETLAEVDQWRTEHTDDENKIENAAFASDNDN